MMHQADLERFRNSKKSKRIDREKYLWGKRLLITVKSSYMISLRRIFKMQSILSLIAKLRTLESS